jgi:hypothetical protein
LSKIEREKSTVVDGKVNNVNETKQKRDINAKRRNICTKEKYEFLT